MILLERLRCLLPACWAGALLSLALMAGPAAFGLLERGDAGRVMGRIFLQEAWLSLSLGVILLGLERVRAQRDAEQGLGSVLSAEMMLVLGALFCTAAGYFGSQPFMAAARIGQGGLSFGQVHAISAAFFGLKILLLTVLAWRGARPSR